MLSPELKAQWLSALRSGLYKQGGAVLRDTNDNFCCLGVLCDIIDSSKWIQVDLDHHYRYPDHNGFFNSAYCSTQLLSSEQQASLAMMNDRGSTFAFIADWIEANV